MNYIDSIFISAFVICLPIVAMDSSKRALAFKNDTAHVITVAHTYVPRSKTVLVDIPTQGSFEIHIADGITPSSPFECFLFEHQTKTRNKTAAIKVSEILSITSNKKITVKNGTRFFVLKK